MMIWRNPVLRRELLAQLRSPKPLYALLGVGIAAALLVMLRWPADATADVLSRNAQGVFRPLVYCLAAATMLLVPAFPATSLVRERSRHTLPLLMLAPIGATSIYTGKFLANVTVAVVLLSASLPSLAAAYAMGGISLRSQLLPLVVVLLGMVVQYTATSLWISSRSHSSDASLRWSYATMLLLAIFPLAPSVILAGRAGWPGELAERIRAVSPIPAIQTLAGDPAALGGALMDASGWIGAYAIATLAVTLPCMLLTLRRLHPSAAERARATGRITDDQSLRTRLIRRLTFVVDPKRRKLAIPRGVNPIMVKEFRTRRFGRVHWLIRLVAACAIVSMGLAVVATNGTIDWGVERIAGALVVFQMALLILIGPSLASGLIAGEREHGGWQLLQMTPLPVARILSGKLSSVLWTLVLILMATLPGYLVMVAVDPSYGPQVGRVSVCLAVAAVMVLSISACVSGFHRQTSVATATNYVALLILFAGTLFVWVLRDQPFGHRLVERALMFNPAAAALAEIGTPGFEEYRLVPHAWVIGGVLSAIALGLLSMQLWRLSRPE